MALSERGGRAVGNWQAGDELSGSRWSGWTPPGEGTAGTAADAGDLTENTTLPMCFATPTHNDTLDGSWVPRTALPGISAAHLETSCKGFQPRLGRWEFADTVRCKFPLGESFVPSACRLPAFDAADFLRLVGENHTLWFVGDSITAQMFASVAVLLAANQVEVQQVKPHLDVWELLGEGWQKKNGRGGVWCFVARGTRACYLKVWKISQVCLD